MPTPCHAMINLGHGGCKDGLVRFHSGVDDNHCHGVSSSFKSFFDGAIDGPSSKTKIPSHTPVSHLESRPVFSEWL